jgi:glutathione S-transferase
MTDADMTLVTSPSSPFGRKARMTACILGLNDRINELAGDGQDPNDPLRVQNPLGKIPLLILANGEAIYDSWVIMEYFDSLAGGNRIIPSDPAQRFPELTRAKLADGIIDASLLIVYEGRYRSDEQRVQSWVERQQGKIFSALDAISQSLPGNSPPLASGITLACALSYLDFRKPAQWRDNYPRLVEWLDAFALAVPAYNQTARPPES